MASTCINCQINWKSIVVFCPNCGTNLKKKFTEQIKEQTTQIKFDYESQSSNTLKSPIFIALVALLAIFAGVAVTQQQLKSPTEQIETLASSTAELDQTSNESSNEVTEVASPEDLTAPEYSNSGTTEDSNLSSTPNFKSPQAKPVLKLNEWLEKYQVDNAINSIQSWAATSTRINPTKIEAAQDELGDANSNLSDLYEFIESSGSPRIPQYDDLMASVMSSIDDYLVSTSELWVQVNNESHNSREDVVKLLEDKVSDLSKVHTKIMSLIEWLKSNGTKYEAR